MYYELHSVNSAGEMMEKGKSMFLYSTVRWTTKNAIHITPGRPVHSDADSTFPGKHSSYAAITWNL